MASKNSSLVLGILGTGEADVETTAALIGDLLDAAEANGQDVSFVLPVTKEHFTDSIKGLADWFIESDIPFEAVSTEESAKARGLKTYLQAATKEHTVKGIPLKMTNLLAAADEGRLLLLWDDDDDECYDAMNKATAKDVKIFDLGNQLDKIVPDDGESDEPDADADADADADPEAGASGGEDFTPYTREELEALEDLDDLKQIASDWDIEVAPRSRAKTYIEAILKAQEEYVTATGGDAEPESKAPARGGDGGTGGVAETVVVNQSLNVDLDPIVACFVQTNELLQGLLDSQAEILQALQTPTVTVTSPAPSDDEEDEPEDIKPPATRMPPRRTPPRRS